MRVLVVDDEVSLATGLKEGLQAEGFAVDVAATGSIGLWLAREIAYDAVVLDVMLPEVDGFEVCRTLRAQDQWVPILMLTAMDGEPAQISAFDVGVDDFITKPFSFAVLVARLRSLIRRRPPERPAVLRTGHLHLDPARKELLVSGAPVELTSREMSLLEFLMRRAGDVLSKREILENVWDFEFDGDPNIVEVYVRRLRVKLGQDSIATLRGSGYRLAVGETDAAT